MAFSPWELRRRYPVFSLAGPLFAFPAGVALGLFGFYRADEALKESLGKALTGEDIQKFAHLEEKQMDLFIEKLLFPLAFWGTTAQSLVALKNVAQKSFPRKQGPNCFKQKSKLERNKSPFQSPSYWARERWEGMV